MSQTTLEIASSHPEVQGLRSSLDLRVQCSEGTAAFTLAQSRKTATASRGSKVSSFLLLQAQLTLMVFAAICVFSNSAAFYHQSSQKVETPTEIFKEHVVTPTVALTRTARVTCVRRPRSSTASSASFHHPSTHFRDDFIICLLIRCSIKLYRKFLDQALLKK